MPFALRSTAGLATGALALATALGAALVHPSVAHAAVLGDVVVSPTSGTDATLWDGSVAAACPGGTDSSFFSLEGPGLDAYEAFLGEGNATGTGAQSFSGASIANIETVTGGPLADGAYAVTFSCFAGPTATDTYTAQLNYTSAGAGSFTITDPTPAATAPGTPGTPTATATASGSATVSWSAPASDGGSPVTSYTVRAHEGGTVVQTVTGVPGTSTTVTGLTNGTAYTFTVAAVNAVGTGAYSPASNPVTPQEPPTAAAPGTPGTPTATAPTTGGSAAVSWSAPASDGGSAVTSYTVQASAGGSVAKTVTGVPGTSTTVTGLTNGTAYTFAVAAVNAVGTGAFSAASNAVVPRAATRTVLSSAPSRLTYGVAAKVVGRLTLSNGTTAVAAQQVSLYVRKKGTTTFVRVATVSTSSTGYATFTSWKPAYPVDSLRLIKSTAGAYLGSASTVKAVTTQRRITTKWSASQVSLGRASTLSGYVFPRSSGLKLVLQRKSGTSWVTVTSKVLPSTTASYSSYAFAVKPTTKGTHYYRVVLAAAGGYTTSVGYAPALKVV